MWWFVLVIAVCFLALHTAKMLRLYLVLMEHKIGFARFLLLYCKTTFVNLVIPFKLGELYRIFKIGSETKIWQVGILSVLIDRFFDIAALFVVLVPLDMLFFGEISRIAWVFFAVILVISFLYLAIPSTYRYLNRHIIMERHSKRSMAALTMLDVVNDWYQFTRELIRGRYALIFLASFAGWIFEIFTLKAMAAFMSIAFDAGSFSDYIQSIFFVGESQIITTYTIMGAVVFLIASVAGVLVCFIKKFDFR